MGNKQKSILVSIREGKSAHTAVSLWEGGAGA